MGVGMDSFVVTYIPSNDTCHAELLSRILAFPCVARIAETTFLVATELTAEQVFSRVAPAPSQGQLYVLAVAEPYCGAGSRKADEWLRANLSAGRKPPAAPPDLIR